MANEQFVVLRPPTAGVRVEISNAPPTQVNAWASRPKCPKALRRATHTCLVDVLNIPQFDEHIRAIAVADRKTRYGAGNV